MVLRIRALLSLGHCRSGQTQNELSCLVFFPLQVHKYMYMFLSCVAEFTAIFALDRWAGDKKSIITLRSFKSKLPVVGKMECSLYSQLDFFLLAIWGLLFLVA